MTEKHVPKESTIAPPCQCACPAGIDVPRYIRRIKEGKFDEALAVIREKIPFPSICGFACYAHARPIAATSNSANLSLLGR